MRKAKIRILLAISLISLSTMMCTLNFNPGDDNSSIIAQQVQETVNAMTMATIVQLTLQQPVEQVQPTQEITLQPLPPATGNITGRLSYPSEMVPPLRIVAFRVINEQQTGEYYYVDTISGPKPVPVGRSPDRVLLGGFICD